jgi:hypothetical protein
MGHFKRPLQNVRPKPTIHYQVDLTGTPKEVDLTDTLEHVHLPGLPDSE